MRHITQLTSRSIFALVVAALLLGGSVSRADNQGAVDSSSNPSSQWVGADLPHESPALADDRCTSPANPVVAENCQPGTSDWVVKDFSDDLEGYAWPYSVNKGETTGFFVNTHAPRFRISIYRSGYYGGMGGRLVNVVEDVKGNAQPGCNSDVNTGLNSCTNWQPSYQLTIPENWTSGVYIAKLTRSDKPGENYFQFTVRDDNRRSEILFQQSFFTYQAYNTYNGKSVYTLASSGCTTVAETPRAVKVSLARPIASGNWAYVAIGVNQYVAVEYPMVRWLEAQGYDVTYSTTLDTHHSGKAGAVNRLLDHRVFLSVGHDEYWTQEMRNAITAARDAGAHLGFFTANTDYWRIRLEPDPFTGEPDSVMVTYKTTESGAVDPVASTSTWRDPAGVNNPENGLIGVQYIGDNNGLLFPLRVTAELGHDRIYRHTGLQNMPPGSYVQIGPSIVGWEWDAVADNGYAPKGLEILATSPVYGLLLQDAGNFKNANLGKALANTTRYTAPSGAIVFASGTIQWSWGLGARGINTSEPDPYVQQITYNILADMGVQPKTPVKSLILDGDSGSLPVPDSMLIFPDKLKSPVIANVHITTLDKQVTATWDTDTPTRGQVWVGETPDHLITPWLPTDSYTTSHSSTNNLDYDTVYYYRILAIDDTDQAVISDSGSFRTEAAALKTRVRQIAESAFNGGSCWVRKNTLLAAGTGLALGLLGLFVAARIVSFVRGRGSHPASSPRIATGNQ